MVKRFDQEAVRKIFVELIANYMTADQTKSEIALQIAEIVAGAPESLDTLKEIADWIEKHADSASAMNSEINANTESITELQTLVSTLENQVAELETEGGEPNVIETVKRNGVTLTVTDKAVDIAVPESMSELTDDVGYAKAGDVDSEIDEVNERIDQIVAEGGEPNVIETVKQNGVALEVTGKAVDVTVPTKMSELENDEGFIDEAVKPNILRGTNSCTELQSASVSDTWQDGKWEVFSNNFQPTLIEVSDAPDPNITIGWDVHAESNSSLTRGIVQSNIPVRSGQQYTISCYARGTDDCVFCLVEQSGNIVVGWAMEEKKDYGDWKLYLADYTPSNDEEIDIGFLGNKTSCDICGMKLEEGSVATPWCPSYWDMENKNGRLVYDEETETMYY